MRGLLGWSTPIWQQVMRGGVAAMVALGLVAVLPAQTMVQAAKSNDRQQAFTAAAQEFGVPESLLLAIAYNQSRWETHKDQPSVAGGFGIMHLTTHVIPEDGRGDPARPLPVRPQQERPRTLDRAAQLLNLSTGELKKDDHQNIRGGAAVLAQYAKELNNGTLPTVINDWYGAVARMSGVSTSELAADFADDVYDTLAKGVARITNDGQQLSLAPQSAQANRSQLGLLGLPSGPKSQDSDRTDCPQTLNCRFIPARFAQNEPSNPTDYGNYDIANRPQDMKIKYIVIHDTEGSYQSAIDWFQDPQSYVAVQYIIRSSDGEVTQMVRTKDIGWQAGNWYMNMHSIGIEHEGIAAEGGAWYTEAMYRSSAKLVRYLAERYDIPLDRQHIIGHDQVPAINPARVPRMHYDPGPYWDWNHYMDLLHEDEPANSRLMTSDQNRKAGQDNHKTQWSWGSRIVQIAPTFAQNQPPVTSCEDRVCVELPRQGANFIYLRTAPDANAPLLTDVGLHPGGEPGTTLISDWSAKAAAGQRFVVAERRGDWTAIWFSGQKGWFYNPWSNPVAKPSWLQRVTPKAGRTSIPTYGRPVPEPEAFIGGTTPFPAVPLPYTIPAGQSYPAYAGKATNDYYQVLTFDRSAPGDGTVVIGNDRYIPIEYNHRQAFVKASDVDLHWW